MGGGHLGPSVEPAAWSAPQFLDERVTVLQNLAARIEATRADRPGATGSDGEGETEEEGEVAAVASSDQGAGEGAPAEAGATQAQSSGAASSGPSQAPSAAPQTSTLGPLMTGIVSLRRGKERIQDSLRCPGRLATSTRGLQSCKPFR